MTPPQDKVRPTERLFRAISLRWSLWRALAERKRLRKAGWYRRRRAA